MTNGEIQLVFNTTEGSKALSDSKSLRQAALMNSIPYYTTISGAVAAVRGIKKAINGITEVKSLQDYFK